MDLQTRPTPPTPDRFDPDLAKQLLGPYLDAGQEVPAQHPLHALYQRWLAWEDGQSQAQARYADRLGADQGVGRDEARAILAIGSLDSDDDYMLVHTRHALRLFVGRGRDPEGKLSRIPGAKNVGAALRTLWLLSHQDHPYADWRLLLTEHEIDDILEQLAQATQAAQARIDRLKESGLHLSILKSREPAKVGLGFRSPYGYMITRLVMAFDLHVRVVKTLTGRNLISAAEERDMINERLRAIRACFERVFRNQNVLQVPAYASLSREDVRAPKTGDVRDRVRALAEIWPGLPIDVLERRKLPRHARQVYRETPRPPEDEVEESVSEGGLL